MKEANKIGLWMVELNDIKDIGIIRCSHKTKEMIITAITLVTEVSGERIIISPIKSSGTIKSLKLIKENL